MNEPKYRTWDYFYYLGLWHKGNSDTGITECGLIGDPYETPVLQLMDNRDIRTLVHGVLCSSCWKEN